MDRDLSEIEKLFKLSLQDDEEIPNAKVWEAIDHVLDKENIIEIKKKYNNLKKISLLLFFLLLCAGFYEFNKGSTIKDSVEIPKDSASQKIIALDTKAITIEAAKSSKNNDQRSQPTSIANPSKLLNKNEDINNRSRESAVETSKINSTSINKDKTFLTTVIQKGRRGSNKNVSIAKNNPAATASKNEHYEENLDKTQRFENENKYYEVSPIAVNVHSVGVVQNVPDPAKSKSFILEGNNATLANATYYKSKKPSLFSINFYFSPGFSYYHLQDNLPGNNVDDVLLIEAKEHYKSSFSVGALIDYKFTDWLGIETGLQYLNTNITLNPTTIYARPDNTGDVKYLLNISSGKGYILPSFSSNPVIGDSLYAFAATHTLKYISVPLNLKYYFTAGKIDFNVIAGLDFNLLINGKVKTYVENRTEQELETVDKLQGLKNVYFTGSVGAGVNYKLYKKMSIGLRPTFRFALNSINKNASVNSFPTSIGLMTGVSYEF